MVLPPLVEWMRVSVAFAEHRQSVQVDSGDVHEGARVLLPGLDCPPKLFNSMDDSLTSGRESPQVLATKVKQEIGWKLALSGRADLIPQAVNLLGPKKLDMPNEKGK